MSTIIIAVLLGICAACAIAGYIRTALDPFGDREPMLHLTIAIILALGFLGLLLK